MRCDRPRAVLGPARSCALSNAIVRPKPVDVAFRAGSVDNNSNDGGEMTLQYCAKSDRLLEWAEYGMDPSVVIYPDVKSGVRGSLYD